MFRLFESFMHPLSISLPPHPHPIYHISTIHTNCVSKNENFRRKRMTEKNFDPAEMNDPHTPTPKKKSLLPAKRPTQPQEQKKMNERMTESPLKIYRHLITPPTLRNQPAATPHIHVLGSLIFRLNPNLTIPNPIAKGINDASPLYRHHPIPSANRSPILHCPAYNQLEILSNTFLPLFHSIRGICRGSHKFHLSLLNRPWVSFKPGRRERQRRFQSANRTQ